LSSASLVWFSLSLRSVSGSILALASWAEKKNPPQDEPRRVGGWSFTPPPVPNDHAPKAGAQSNYAGAATQPPAMARQPLRSSMPVEGSFNDAQIFVQYLHCGARIDAAQRPLL